VEDSLATHSGDVIEFPGEPTMAAGSAVPPERVELPLQAGPRRHLLVSAPFRPSPADHPAPWRAAVNRTL